MIPAINVSLGSNGVSERLRSLSGFGSFFGFGIDGLRRRGLTSAPMDAIDGLILFFRLTRSPRRSPHSICTVSLLGHVIWQVWGNERDTVRSGRLLSLEAHRDRPRHSTNNKRNELPPRHPHSTTSSARVRSVGGIGRPSDLAVLKFTRSSNLDARKTGISEGLAPLRISSIGPAMRRHRSAGGEAYAMSPPMSTCSWYG